MKTQHSEKRPSHKLSNQVYCLHLKDKIEEPRSHQHDECDGFFFSQISEVKLCLDVNFQKLVHSNDVFD